MKTKTIITIGALALTLSATSANAQGLQVGLQAKVGSTSAQVNATSSINKNKNASTTPGNATSTAARDDRSATTTHASGVASSTDHRSVVATFVQSLLSVANREGGIGAQVRVIAQSQNDSASTTAAAMTNIESRGSFRTFFAGSDYKNLGVIRREIATTTANIAKLKTLLSQATSEATRVELSTQIKALEDEQARIEAYMKTNQSKFSLFGWFNKLFIK